MIVGRAFGGGATKEPLRTYTALPVENELLVVVNARPFVPHRIKCVGTPTTFEIVTLAMGVSRWIS